MITRGQSSTRARVRHRQLSRRGMFKVSVLLCRVILVTGLGYVFFKSMYKETNKDL